MVISKTGFLHINSHLAKEDILELSRIQVGWCLSLYPPMRHDAPEANQGRILLKDLDAKARRELALRGLPPREIESILAPLERLLESDLPHLEGHGLAVLSSVAGSACFPTHRAPCWRWTCASGWSPWFPSSSRRTGSSCWPWASTASGSSRAIAAVPTP